MKIIWVRMKKCQKSRFQIFLFASSSGSKSLSAPRTPFAEISWGAYSAPGNPPTAIRNSLRLFIFGKSSVFLPSNCFHPCYKLLCVLNAAEEFWAHIARSSLGHLFLLSLIVHHSILSWEALHYKGIRGRLWLDAHHAFNGHSSFPNNLCFEITKMIVSVLMFCLQAIRCDKLFAGKS